MEKIKETAKELWNFFRAAGVLQAVVDGKAFRSLKDLPDENWAVLSCPTAGLNFDAKTLSFIDVNNDGHIRIAEVLKAIDWLSLRLGDMDGLLKNSDVVALSAFADTAEGKELKEVAKALLATIGKADAEEISLADVMARQATFLAAEFNGDGVLVPASAKDEARAKLFGEIIAATGGVDDRSGVKGIDKATIEAFYGACASYIAWLEKGRAEAETVYPLGDATEGAVAALEAVRAKVEDYFHRCRLIAFDGAASKPLNRGEADYAAIAQDDMAKAAEAIATFPISHVDAGASLRLREGVNPEWSQRLAVFADKVAAPILGNSGDAITEEEWRTICGKLAPFIAWKGSIAGANVASLGEARIKELLADTASKDELLALIEKDIACSGEITHLDDLEKFVRLHANINRFLNNFVNFSDYYNPECEEIYRAGRLYIDGRVCKECVFVDNMAAHATLAASSKIFLAYCNITRPQTGEKRVICAAVTAGFASTIWVGRNGIFYDTKGGDWNAVVVKICDCQISLKEAFWAPWIKISDLIGAQVKKLLSAKETAMMGAATTKVSTSIPTTPAPAPAADQKRDGAAMASSVAAVGIAIGIIGSALGGLISAIKGVSFWQGILGVLAIFLIVSGPAVILAWFKIRARDFAPVLNACGWAINKKMRMPLRLSKIFTHEAIIPTDSKIAMHDPYHEKHFWRNTLIVIAILALGYGWVWWFHSNWLPENLRRKCPAKEKVECVEKAVAPEAAAATAPAVAPKAAEAATK